MASELGPASVTLRERRAARYQTTTASNVLSVIGMFTEREYVRLNDVRDQLGVSSATAYRLLSSLEAAGFSERVSRRGYRAGARALQWAANLLANLDARYVARPVMRRLLILPGEAVYLAILRETALVVVETVHAGAPTITALESLREDMRVQIHAAALGRSVAAHLDPGRLAQLLGPEPYPRLTERTPTTWRELSIRLDDVRMRGHAISQDEADIGVSAVAAAIFSDREVIGSLSITAPSAQFDGARMEVASGLVKRAADRISHLISAD